MASFVWAKMWIDTLDDYKLGLLNDHLWRRFFEFVLMAKEADAGGYLPKLPAMAWRLRTIPQEIETDLLALAVDDLELLTLDEHGWYVTNFTKRQETAMDSAERKRRQRDRERHEQYAGTSRDCHETVTARDIEEKRGDIEGEGEERPAPSPTNGPHPAFAIYEQISAHLLTAKVQMDDIIEHVPRDNAAILRWGEVVRAWIGMGWKPTNVTGMLDHFREGRIPGRDYANTARAPPDPVPKQEPVIVSSEVWNSIPGVEDGRVTP